MDSFATILMTVCIKLRVNSLFWLLTIPNGRVGLSKEAQKDKSGCLITVACVRGLTLHNFSHPPPHPPPPSALQELKPIKKEINTEFSRIALTADTQKQSRHWVGIHEREFYLGAPVLGGIDIRHFRQVSCRSRWSVCLQILAFSACRCQVQVKYVTD